MRVYHDFFLVPGFRSTFPDTDPDSDPAKWYGSDCLLPADINTRFFAMQHVSLDPLSELLKKNKE